MSGSRKNIEHDLKFSNGLLLRTPVFPASTFSSQDPEHCLEVPIFLEAIRLASKDLYYELERSSFKFSKLDHRIRLSVWKYWNRMHFRPTPFGLFAAFSFVKWHKDAASLQVEDLFKYHIRNNFRKTEQLFNETSFNTDPTEISYIAADTLYPIQNTYRYLNYVHDIKTGKRVFQLDEVEKNEYLAEVLAFCRNPKVFSEIINNICDDFQFPETESTGYIQDLIRSKVLQPATQLQITGDSYCLLISEDRKEENDILTLCAYKDPYSLCVNTERPLLNDQLSDKYQSQIIQAVTCLRHLCTRKEHIELGKFKTDLLNRYDRQCIPLLQALDPEAGVGYADLALGRANPALLKGFSFVQGTKMNTIDSWTPVHIMLLQKWNQVGNGNVISLSEADLTSISLPVVGLPNSLSVIFRVTNEQVFIEQAGGATGTALMGRFTPLNADVHALSKELAACEEMANPECIFAEIAYIGDPHTANIDRRERIYRFEIPILCGSVTTSDDQILLSDLWVSVEHDKIFLWSKKHRRRVIPRLSSAYNYLNSTLPVFRFLCDLQSQDLQTDLNFDLQQVFPDLPFYPRIEYRSSILQLATWVLDADTVRRIAKTDQEGQAAQILQLAQNMHWPRYISLSEFDNQLVFDIDNEEHRLYFATQFKGKEKIVIKEFVSEQGQHALVQNRQKETFINQFVSTLYHSDNIYAPGKFPSDITYDTANVRRQFIPGSEWLYYKLYLHPIRSNEVLVRYILKGTRKLKTKGLIRQWFFVRYADPRYHLRIRIQIATKHAGQVLSQFEKIFEQLASAGVIRGYGLETYDREIERYTAQLIEACEHLFCSSSQLIVAWLEITELEDSDYNYYRIAFSSIRTMLDIFEIAIEERIILFKNLYDRSASELLPDNAENRAQMKQKYRELNLQLLNTEKKIGMMLPKKTIIHFQRAVKQVAELGRDMKKDDKHRLLTDLMHMHLNRLLVDNSREQEMILYYSFWKLLRSEAAQSRSGLPFTFNKIFIDPV